MYLSGRSSSRLRQRGIALVVVLSMVVVVALILIAFVTAMRLERTASTSYSQSINADEIARGALSLITADLINEMSADAPPSVMISGQPPSATNKPLFTNVTAANILPRRVGTNAAMPNLVRISTTNATYTNGSVPGLTASSVSSTAKSADGRYVARARWEAPYLGSYPSDNDTPRWVIVTRSGVTNAGTFTGANALNNPSQANTNYAIGRFAYAIYDIGGLMDVTVAGYPTSTLSTADIEKIKGTLAGANLTALGINAQSLVDWRNKSSSSSTANYLSMVTNYRAIHGADAVAAGDTTFFSRQDLIRAAKLGVAGLNTNGLTNLTVFSRELNAPSWRPQDIVGSSIAYGTLANSATSTNTFAPLLRYSTSGEIRSYKVDGTSYTYAVQPGDPVAGRRFPLDRIRWIGADGPANGGTAESIHACFGLEWDGTTGVWKYVGPKISGAANVEQTSIKTLAQVATEQTKREPNFFELLQAAILTGSLGLDGDPATPNGYEPFYFYTTHEASKTLHIFRIGASIISSYEPSAQPCVIEYNQSGEGWQATGIDDLPYLNTLSILAGLDPSSAPGSAVRDLNLYLMVGLWNPSRSAVAQTNRPPVRLRAKGVVAYGNEYGSMSTKIIPYADSTLERPGIATNLNLSAELSTTGTNGAGGFTDPHMLYPSDLMPGSDWGTLPSIKGTSLAGLKLPNFSYSTTKVPTAADVSSEYKYSSQWTTLAAYLSYDATRPFNAWLEYKNKDGNWVPYTYFGGINDPVTWAAKPALIETVSMHMRGWLVSATNTNYFAADPPPFDPTAAQGATNAFVYRKGVFVSTDPRSLRFNQTFFTTSMNFTDWAKFLWSSLWSSATDPAFASWGLAGSQTAQAIFGPPWLPSGVARNNNTNFTKASTNNNPAMYVDPDGVRRIADSGLYTTSDTTTWKGNPWALSAQRSSDRPFILNRPYYSVGELGYISRDYPFRTLDFWTDKSADAGLLDFFTVDNTPSKHTVGKVNLNTKSPEILTALLNNSLSDALSGTTYSYSTNAANLIISSTATTPIFNKGEIATRLTSSYSGTGTSDDAMLKPRREAITRALADVGQVRTWNLLIDVFAQAGRYSQNATKLDDFIVEGERHFWLHIAIYRFTGEIVDQRLELVNP